MRTLTTTSEVIDALGGTTRLAQALGLSKASVSVWRTGTITTRYRDVMLSMLGDLDEPCTAPAALWGMVTDLPADSAEVA